MPGNGRTDKFLAAPMVVERALLLNRHAAHLRLPHKQGKTGFSKTYLDGKLLFMGLGNCCALLAGSIGVVGREA
jgi:hypothetical protein